MISVRQASPNPASSAAWRTVAAILAVLSLLWTPMHAAMAIEMRLTGTETCSHSHSAESVHADPRHGGSSKHEQNAPKRHVTSRQGCECGAAPEVTLPGQVVLALPLSVPTVPVAPSTPRVRTLDTTPVARGPPFPS
ncbi:hypothetical protein [Deinococcus yavapaiensis]|uniref:DUF2946 family protein n=1 Tax=Deinococcus yavapaiensis KR-236 TaxID=694435 RepID=A0A318SEA2_9DEIO|nr:hypothetical protein [Deinococcus yavapaiensis]PYE54832.1 hypothetical protein DES52_104103 [Deinococcus yavapaiensis KR-236]